MQSALYALYIRWCRDSFVLMFVVKSARAEGLPFPIMQGLVSSSEFCGFAVVVWFSSLDFSQTYLLAEGQGWGLLSSDH